MEKIKVTKGKNNNLKDSFSNSASPLLEQVISHDNERINLGSVKCHYKMLAKNSSLNKQLQEFLKKRRKVQKMIRYLYLKI